MATLPWFHPNRSLLSCIWLWQEVSRLFVAWISTKIPVHVMILSPWHSSKSKREDKFMLAKTAKYAHVSSLELCHEKMCLKIFVDVIPKEGLASRAPSILLLVWHWLQNKICEDSRIQCYSQCHTQRRIGWAPPASPSLGMTATKILRQIFSWHSSLLLRCILHPKLPFWSVFSRAISSGLDNAQEIFFLFGVIRLNF